MKIAAHPLVVAAALGLIGPVALEEEEWNDTDCADCHESVDASELIRAEEAFNVASAKLDEQLHSVTLTDT